MERTNPNTALACAFVEELARCGVRHACVSPGSRSAPLALALWKEPAISVWTHVDERCAGFFALGISQRTGMPALVLTTSGTAGANLHPAVAEASEARVPLIVVTADRPPELRGRGAGQTIDQLKLYGSAVRWFCELGVQRADDTGLLHFRSTVDRAVAEALGRPPGPVHLNVPLQEPLAPVPAQADVTAAEPLAVDGRSGGRPVTRVRQPRIAPDAETVAAVATLIEEHPRGVVLAGRQRDPALAGPVAELARKAGYPILAEPTSQLRAGLHELGAVVAGYDGLLREAPDRLRPQLVLRVGDMVTSKAVREWLTADPQPRQVAIDPDGGWNEPSSRAEEILRVDAALLSSAVTDAMPRRDPAPWLEGWLDAARLADELTDDFLDALGQELFEPRVHRQLAGMVPPGSTVYVASSMPVRDLEAFFPVTAKPLCFLANRGANGIDGLVSSGLGAAAAGGGRTIVLAGDLSLYHDMNGLLAMRRLGLDATIVVLDNGGGAIFDFLPIADHPHGYEELFATPTGLDLERVASLYELPFTRVGSHDDLQAALERSGLVQVPLDRRRNVELHRELFERIAQSVRSPLDRAAS